MPANLRIVLVEDDSVTTAVLTASLDELGARNVVVARDGNEALSALADGYTGEQVVFCDLKMPGMDGLALLRHLAKQSTCVGVVVLSAEDGRVLASAVRLARAHGLRVFGALRKPVSRDRLRQVLLDACSTGAKLPTFRPARGAFQPTAAELSQGIANRELVVHYQPRMAPRESRVLGVEALVRWQHPSAGLVPPGAFVPLAEQGGLIDALTRLVLEIALTDLAEWRRQGMDIAVSLNATVDTLARLDFAEELTSLAAAFEVPPTSLIVEVTESRLALHLERVLETLTRLRLNHVGVAIDDFGTGYSTMDQLRLIPFTELKIDGRFVHGAREDDTVRAILESSTRLARELGMTSVAEGVETADDLDAVLHAGCDAVQGFLFAKPMPEHELVSWVRNANAGNVFPAKA
jgi:EAL domain-containing protein (putative c-di-GMP-specific phosphodiesterase class I)/AmiR/NasT family two-component response regulator